MVHVCARKFWTTFILLKSTASTFGIHCNSGTKFSKGNNFFIIVFTLCPTYCDVEFNMEFMCTVGDDYGWLEEVKLLINKERGFTGYGAQIFDVTATTDSRWESQRTMPKTVNIFSTKSVKNNVAKVSENRNDNARSSRGVNGLANSLHKTNIAPLNPGIGGYSIPEMLQ